MAFFKRKVEFQTTEGLRALGSPVEACAESYQKIRDLLPPRFRLFAVRGWKKDDQGKRMVQAKALIKLDSNFNIRPVIMPVQSDQIDGFFVKERLVRDMLRLESEEYMRLNSGSVL